MKSVLKRAVEGLLAHGGPAALARSRHRGRTLILAYHNVVPDDDARGNPDSLHLALSDFRGQLDLLESRADVVPLEGALAATPAGVSDRPRVVVTFDDAYRGALELAVPELLRRALPATIFVCPGLLEAESFWWDVFDPAGAEETVFRQLAADHDAVFDFFGERGAVRRTPSGWRRPSSLEVLRPLLARPDGPIRFGSHTWSHPNLAALRPEAVREQLVLSREWLAAHAVAPIPWLACPYGFNSPEVARIAAEVGYVGALEIAGGWVPEGGGDRFRTPRLNVPAGVSEAGFELRVAGLVRR